MTLASTGSLSAQVAPSSNTRAQNDPVELSTYVVTSTRASLVSAQEIKRDRLEIVDSIVANDINKLPDINVTDALQRIAGIQVQRDRGEGAQVVIRGLSQMETTLNGREIFTAGLHYTGAPSRTVDFADIPAEMVASINVYKTSSAEHTEGGIGGLIEMTTRRPFDFKEGLQAVASVRMVHGDLAKKWKPLYSALVSNRWKLAGGGELGALVNFTYQDRAWREDSMGISTPAARTDILAGQTITTQNSIGENANFGTRERTGVSSVIQWRPSPALELYAEANYAKFYTYQDTHQINLTGSNPVAGSAVLAPGTSDLQKVTWGTTAVSILSFARDLHDWHKQFAIGGTWRRDRLTVKVDTSYLDTFNDLYFAGPFFAGTAGRSTHDLTGEVPSVSLANPADVTNPANFAYTGIAYRFRPYYGDIWQTMADATYRLDGGFFKSLHFGLRYAERNANNGIGLIFGDHNYPAASRPPVTRFPNEVVNSNAAGFFNRVGTAAVRDFMTGRLEGTRDIVAYRARFGLTDALPATASPLQRYNIDETTTAAYLMSRFSAQRLPFDGNIGARFIRTDETLRGARGTSAATATPFTQHSEYNNVLPSLNARYRIQDGLFLRFAASKTLSRPGFQQLSPSITLVPNPVNPALNQGGSGNPDLKPVKSMNADFAIEKYFNASTSVYATVFYKDVDGFIVSSGQTERHDGQDYLITRPRNSDPAKIKGIEVGYQQFFDFLPAPFKSLGVQANYTYIDSETRNATLQTNTSLQNISRNSYNIIAMYETKKISARVAYNWRDTFLSGQTSVANVGRFGFFTKAYGWMDASLGYNFTEKVSLNIEGSNLLRTKRISYYGVENRPQSIITNDRQFSAVVTYRF